MKPSDAARALGIHVERRTPPAIAGVRLHAEYCARPPSIVVYCDDFERAVAHELYHHFGGRDEAEARAFAEAWLGRD